jgi:hypothetical protein
MHVSFEVAQKVIDKAVEKSIAIGVTLKNTICIS